LTVKRRLGVTRARASSRGPDILELWTWELRAGERFQGATHPASTLELIAVERGALSIAFDEVSYVIGTGASAGDRWAPVRRGALVLVVAYATALAASTRLVGQPPSRYAASVRRR
jgi:hypothetical protein